MKLSVLSGLVCLVAFCMGCQMITVEEDPNATPSALVTAQSPITTTAALTETSTVTGTPAVTATASLTNIAVVTETSLPTTTPGITATADVTTTGVTTTTGSADLAGRGMELYRQQFCGVCHQLTAIGSMGTFGPSHDGMGALAAQRIADPNYTGTATTSAEYLHESLVDPQLYIVPGYEISSHQMPSYKFLPEADLDALVEFLLQQ